MRVRSGSWWRWLLWARQRVTDPEARFEAGPATRADFRRSHHQYRFQWQLHQYQADRWRDHLHYRQTPIFYGYLSDMGLYRVSLVINLIMRSGEGTGRSEPDDGGLFRKWRLAQCGHWCVGARWECVVVRESRDDDGCFEQGNVLGPRDAFSAGPATRADSRHSAPTSDGKSSWLGRDHLHYRQTPIFYGYISDMGYASRAVRNQSKPCDQFDHGVWRRYWKKRAGWWGFI